MAGDTSGNRGNHGRGAPRGENQWPAGATADDVWSEGGKARALANLSPDGAITHGLSRFLAKAIAPPCERCIGKDECDRYCEGATCALAEEYQADVIAQTMALPQIQQEDAPLVREYAKQATALQIVDRYIAFAGPLLPGADKGFLDVQPVLKERTRISGLLVKLASELGLSPAARARIGAKSGNDDLSKLADILRGLEPKTPTKVIEGTFTTSEEDAPGGQAATEQPEGQAERPAGPGPSEEPEEATD